MPNRVRHTFYVYRGWERDARKVMTVGVCGCNDTNENDAAENRLFWISFIPHILLLVLRLDACWWWWWYDGCVDGISPGHKTANSSTVKWTLSNSFHFPCRALLLLLLLELLYCSALLGQCEAHRPQVTNDDIYNYMAKALCGRIFYDCSCGCCWFILSLVIVTEWWWCCRWRTPLDGWWLAIYEL